MSDLVIGIDGGGSRTRAVLSDLAGNVLGTGEAGTSNPMVHGVAAAQRELELAIARAFENANLPRERVAALCMGLAGADRVQVQQQLTEWAIVNLAEKARVVNDAEIVLVVASAQTWGVALIAGTGSFAWGKNRASETARAGGWGYLLGDEGSAFDLARQALRASTQAADGRAEPTRLLEAVLDFWNLAEPRDLVAYVYRPERTHSEIARLAPIVLRTAKEGDAVAQHLVDQAANALAAAVDAVSRTLHLNTAAFPLALTGGLVLGSPALCRQIVSLLEQRGSRVSPTELVHEPVIGAVKLALELVK